MAQLPSWGRWNGGFGATSCSLGGLGNIALVGKLPVAPGARGCPGVGPARPGTPKFFGTCGARLCRVCAGSISVTPAPNSRRASRTHSPHGCSRHLSHGGRSRAELRYAISRCRVQHVIGEGPTLADRIAQGAIPTSRQPRRSRLCVWVCEDTKP